jgi:hypothetical protein
VSSSPELERLLEEASDALDRDDDDLALRLVREALSLGEAPTRKATRYLFEEVLTRLRKLIDGTIWTGLWRAYEALSQQPSIGFRPSKMDDLEGPPSPDPGPDRQLGTSRPRPTPAGPPAARRHRRSLDGGGPAAALPNDDREAAPAEDEPLRRTPHLQLAGEPVLAPGTAFQAHVWADTRAPDAGTRTSPIEILGPASQRTFALSVLLTTSAHCRIEGPILKELKIRRSEPESGLLTFDLRVVDSLPADDGEAFLQAIFLYQGRASGSVRLPLRLGKSAETKTAAPAQLVVDPSAQLADLQVMIGRQGDGWTCHVQSPRLESLRAGRVGEWDLDGPVATIVNRHMNEFKRGGLTPKMRRAALLGAGKKFFEAAPPVFRDAFWQLVDAGKPPASIAIISEEPYLPWELMVPHRRQGLSSEQRDPLGVECAIGRWTHASHVAPVQSVRLRRAFVVCPTDSNLTASAEEAAMVIASVAAGESVDPASADRLDELLGQDPPSLLHFICHGKTDEDSGQYLTLQGKLKLSTTMLSGLEGVCSGLQRGRPLVFLNACEVGRQEIDLASPDGFAQVFMQEGAAAVIAPLWSVKDGIAHEIAATFYRQLKKGEPLAAILRDLRAKSYEDPSEDTYAAYCFYGDPLAVGEVQ